MKRKILTCLILLAAILGAEHSAAQFRYGPTAGVNMSTLSFKQDLVTVDRTLGYTAGIGAEMMFPGIGFGIDLGLMYNQLGATVNMGEKEMWSSQGYGKERFYLHYVEIPLHLRFKYTRLGGLEEKIAPFAYAGPSFQFLAGHNKIEAIDYAGGCIGIDTAIGCEILEKWQVSAGYSFGMTYALKAKILTNYSARNNSWFVRVAYLF